MRTWQAPDGAAPANEAGYSLAPGQVIDDEVPGFLSKRKKR